ncbi:sensor domain-containing protein [Nocardia seriolae]|uniref:sensor domain-containing protein n=1 Tax=Nocardia seriolae TaxID=37332 RepID=UPI0034E94322
MGRDRDDGRHERNGRPSHPRVRSAHAARGSIHAPSESAPPQPDPGERTPWSVLRAFLLSPFRARTWKEFAYLIVVFGLGCLAAAYLFFAVGGSAYLSIFVLGIPLLAAMILGARVWGRIYRCWARCCWTRICPSRRRSPSGPDCSAGCARPSPTGPPGGPCSSWCSSFVLGVVVGYCVLLTVVITGFVAVSPIPWAVGTRPMWMTRRGASFARPVQRLPSRHLAAGAGLRGRRCDRLLPAAVAVPPGVPAARAAFPIPAHPDRPRPEARRTPGEAPRGRGRRGRHPAPDWNATCTTAPRPGWWHRHDAGPRRGAPRHRRRRERADRPGAHRIQGGPDRIAGIGARHPPARPGTRAGAGAGDPWPPAARSRWNCGCCCPPGPARPSRPSRTSRSRSC